MVSELEVPLRTEQRPGQEAHFVGAREALPSGGSLLS